MPDWVRWAIGLAIGLSIVIVPLVHFRDQYAHAKRLRIVMPGRFYRCGQLTADGFEEVFDFYGIRTVINLQDESPDPLLSRGYFDKPRIPESEVCKRHGVRYILLNFDLMPRDHLPVERPSVIDRYLRILDDPDAYPILLHCKAGLHRTGLMTALYRIEKEGWSRGAAVRELRANGFGDAASTTANDYVYQFLELYITGQRRLPASPIVHGAIGVGARARLSDVAIGSSDPRGAP